MGTRATALLTHDLLPGLPAASGTSGCEIAVSFADEAGDGGVRLMPTPTAALPAMIDIAAPSGGRPSGLAAGDADGDGRVIVSVYDFGPGDDVEILAVAHVERRGRTRLAIETSGSVEVLGD